MVSEKSYVSFLNDGQAVDIVKLYHIVLAVTILMIPLMVSNGAFADNSMTSFTSPALVQFRAGTVAGDTVCIQDMTLVIKSENNHPACVSQSTAQRLVQMGWGTINPQQNKPSPENPSDANNNFAFSLLGTITQKDNGNVFFSPYSITNAFSMLYEGAQGSTSSEMESVFHFIQDDTARKDYVLKTNSDLNNPSQPYKLGVANALWVQNDYPVLSSYTNTLNQYYTANATNLDLKNDSENSRNTINNWVADKTNQKILNLLPEGSINSDTRLVLTNAIYFKGNWTNPFESSETTNQTFTTLDQGQVQIPMMSNITTFGYFEDNNTQALKMPYLGGHLSMIVLLPKDGNIKSLENSLSVAKLQQLDNNMTQEQVAVYMPKFALHTSYSLNDYLSSMGMPSAFTPNVADFTGITGNKDLSIDTAVHQAFVKVDEKGTESAAATGISMTTSAMPLVKDTFRADHPFVFMIYDDQTGLVLFIGQVVNPSAT